VKPGDTLVIASHNPGKVPEIAALLGDRGLVLRSAAELGLPEPEETGATFADNAALKARASARASGFWSLADDSGLAVAALEGAPGIYSARWAGPSKDFAAAMSRIERELRAKGDPDPSAEFVCALALSDPDGGATVFEGRIEGTLTFPPRGQNGFGYDPIFVARGMHQTFGELEPAHKHAISHRARAFAQLVASGRLPA
jgi:XTP/dITP diphosphohydrolase